MLPLRIRENIGRIEVVSLTILIYQYEHCQIDGGASVPFNLHQTAICS